MSVWIELWKGSLIVALVLFMGMAFVVSVGGFFDIVNLFRRLSRDDPHGDQRQAIHQEKETLSNETGITEL